jgi:integrase/recombinase XerD
MVHSRRVRIGGALAPLVDGFRVMLEHEGYTPHGTVKQLHLFAHLSRWLEAERLELADLDRESVERFFCHRREVGYTKLISLRAADPMLRYLRGLGFIADTTPPVLGNPVEELLVRYQRYLVLERGLLPESARGYAVNVRPFVEGLAGPLGIELDRLDGPAVVAFVVATCPAQTHSSAKRTVKALRSLLRYLHAEAYVDRSLVHVVPAAAGWRLASLPKRLEAEEVQRLLDACDRSTVVGSRDFAVLMLLARLGLRVGEVAALSLEDIDWRAGEVVVRGKHGHHDLLPLPADVGEAIVVYLRNGRPADALDRTVFVRVRAPHRALTGPGVGKIVKDAAARAGLRVHAHQLRHTIASEMLRAGASLPEIGQVLRHRHPETTAIYAKVDRDALRQIARLWPGAAR